jgi:hypothetical protein
METLIVHRDAKKVHANRARATTNMASAMVPLWLILDETNPETSEPIKTPNDPMKKIEPAWLLVRLRSCTMEGIKGENIKRLMKGTKKSNVKKMILPIMAFKGSGVGQVLLFMSAPMVYVRSSLFSYQSVYLIFR